MKHNILYTSLAYLLLCSLVFVACCKQKCTDPNNPECGNYDACLKSLKATFKIYESCGSKYFESDTVVSRNLTKFEATCEADSFIWYLGAEIIRAKSFERKDFPFNSNIPITLIVKKKNLIAGCVNDKLVDTVLKSIYVLDASFKHAFEPDTSWVTKPYEYRPIQGSYLGYYKSNPELKCTLTYKIKPVITKAMGPELIVYTDEWLNFPLVGQGTNRNKQYYKRAPDYHTLLCDDNATCFGFGYTGDYLIAFDTLIKDNIYGFDVTTGYGWLDAKNHNNITIGFNFQLRIGDPFTNQTLIDTFYGVRLK
jgi:hypothetical protein